MDFALAADDDSRRLRVRNWLADNPDPSPENLARAGYVKPRFPAPWGQGADVLEELIIDEELASAGVSRPDNVIALGWAAPTLLNFGTTEQRERHLWPILTGAEQWCQLFSEPNSGSDLASLQTRAERDGDEWVINGQKIWTSGAELARFGMLLARTDPDAPQHRGITWFICPMDRPGIEIRPIIEMTGNRHFNEVFFTDVRIPSDNVVGELHTGWRAAKFTLANERVALSGGGAIWGMGPSVHDLLDRARAAGVAKKSHRQELAHLYVEDKIIQLIGLRILTDLVAGREPGAIAEVKKLMADRAGQRIMNLAKDLAGPDGMLTDRGPFGEATDTWNWGFLFSPALTIGGGTSQILLNVIAERMLGLPREPKARTSN